MSGVGDHVPRWAVRLLLVLAVGTMLGRLGPFDTFGELSSGERYAYWIGLTLLMWLQGVALLALVEPLAQRGWPLWRRVIVAALLAAVPTAFEVAWAEMLLRVQRDLGPGDILAIVGDVAMLSVPLLLLTHGWQVDRHSPSVDAERSEGSAALLALMEPRRRGRLVAIGSEDHYVRLYTDKADQLISMRFSDAVTELASVEGLQVHRRWWVASNAVDRIARSGDSLELRLSNGLIVPVSRSYAQQVRKAWADRLS